MSTWYSWCFQTNRHGKRKHKEKENGKGKKNENEKNGWQKEKYERSPP